MRVIIKRLIVLWFLGTQFRTRATHFKGFNEFLENKREVFQSFITKLTDVEGLGFRLEMYNLLKFKRERPVTISATYNQIILIHRVTQIFSLYIYGCVWL